MDVKVVIFCGPLDLSAATSRHDRLHKWCAYDGQQSHWLVINCPTFIVVVVGRGLRMMIAKKCNEFNSKESVHQVSVLLDFEDLDGCKQVVIVMGELQVVVSVLELSDKLSAFCNLLILGRNNWH